METNVANNMLSQKSRQKDRPQIKRWVRITRIFNGNSEWRIVKQETLKPDIINQKSILPILNIILPICGQKENGEPVTTNSPLSIFHFLLMVLMLMILVHVNEFFFGDRRVRSIHLRFGPFK